MSTVSEPARGDVWHVRLDPIVGREQGGERPCLVISDDRFNHSRAQLAIVLPITSTHRGIPSHVRVEPPEGGLSAVSFIKCEDIRSIAKERLKSKWGTISAKALAIVEDHLRILMNL